MSYQVFQSHRSGIGHTAPYLVGGVPFITGSENMSAGGAVERKIEFPYVTRRVTVINRTSGSADLKVHFATRTGTNVDTHYHYITLDSKEDSVSLDVRVKEIYISSTAAHGSFELFAELTSIPTSEMFKLTGSGVTNRK